MVVNLVVWLHMLPGPWCMSAALFRTCLTQVLNSAADIHQQGPDNVCGHTARLTTMMYFNQMF